MSEGLRKITDERTKFALHPVVDSASLSTFLLCIVALTFGQISCRITWSTWCSVGFSSSKSMSEEVDVSAAMSSVVTTGSASQVNK